jgi:hypothetical protein
MVEQTQVVHYSGKGFWQNSYKFFRQEFRKKMENPFHFEPSPKAFSFIYLSK